MGVRKSRGWGSHVGWDLGVAGDGVGGWILRRKRVGQRKKRRGQGSKRRGQRGWVERWRAARAKAWERNERESWNPTRDGRDHRNRSLHSVGENQDEMDYKSLDWNYSIDHASVPFHNNNKFFLK